MDPYDFQGYFWLPGHQDNRVIDGRLFSDPNGFPNLHLNGELAPEQPPIPCIYGVIEDGGGRGLISLWWASPMGQSVRMPGRTRDRYRVRLILDGAHLSNEPSTTFRECHFLFSGVENWATGLTGLKDHGPPGGKTSAYTIEYRQPAPLVAKMDDLEIKLIAASGGDSESRRREVNERVFLTVTPRQALPLEKWNSDYVYPFQNLFTLATDAPNALARWRVFPTDPNYDDRQIEVRFARFFRDEEVAQKAWPRFLFSLSSVEDRLADFFSRWLAFNRDYAEASSVYFGTRYSPQLPLDLQMPSTLQAVALYARKKHKTSPRLVPEIANLVGGIPPEFSETLAMLLSTNFILNAEAALRSLSSEHAQLLAWLTHQSPVAFVESVTNTLAYLQSRDPGDWQKTPMAAPESQGIGLYLLTQQLAWLMKACMLDELGFNESARMDLIKRNENARHLQELSQVSAHHDRANKD